MSEKVILDTNIFVAAGFKEKSASGSIVRAVEQNVLLMMWNEATRKEIELILGKIPPLRNFGIQEFFTQEGYSSQKPDREGLQMIEDPDDVKFAALARVTGALLVSNDEHLLRIRGKLRGVKVMTAGEAAEELKV